MRKKFTLLFAALLACVGVLKAETYNGIYTIGVDENIQRGYVAAGQGYANYPVLSGITLSGYTQNDTEAVENGKNWYFRSIDEGATYFIYNVAVGKFLVGTGSQINFGDAPYAWSIEANGNYKNIKDVAVGKYLSGGCGRNAANRPIAYDTNKNDDGAKHTITTVADGTTTFATQIAAADAQIQAYKTLLGYASSNQAFFLKNVTADRYMTIVATEQTNNNAGGLQIKDKVVPTSLKQVFFLVESNGQFKIKSGENYFLTSFSAWGYKATATDSDQAKHTIALSGENYTLRGALGLIGPNSGSTGDGSWIYSNHSSGEIYWNFELLTESDVVALQLPEVKAKLDEAVASAAAAISAHTALNENQKAAINAAVTAAQTCYNNIDAANATYTDVDAVEEAIDAIVSAVNNAIYVWNVADLSNNVCYVVSTFDRGSWYSEDKQLNSTNKLEETTNGLGDVNQHFAFLKSNAGNYYIYSVAKKKFVNVSGDYTALESNAKHTVEFLAATGDKKAAYPWVISLNKKHVGISNSYSPGVITFWNDQADGGNMVRLEVATAVDAVDLSEAMAAVELYETVLPLETAIAAVQEKINGMGDNLGYYSTTNANAVAEFNAIVEFKKAITNETSVDAIEAKTNEANALAATFSINLPAEGKFYRFSYDYGDAGVKYVQAVASGATDKANGMLMSEDTGAESIFYYADGKLLSYTAGLYVKEYDNIRGLQSVGSEAGAARFVAGSTVGKLYIYAGDSFHANKSGDIYFIDHCRTPHASEHNFTIEEVTSLPVNLTTIGDNSWATLYAPVALEIPEDVVAYTGALNGEWLTLTAIEGDAIPAETAVILMGAKDAGAKNFAVTTTEATIANNALTGTVAAKANNAATAEEGDLIPYTLQIGNNSVVFKQYTGTNLNGFRAYLELEKLAADAPAGAISIRFGEGTTSIDNGQLTMDNEAAVIYDILGRRVEAMTKGGIYIVNGKKVIK